MTDGQRATEGVDAGGIEIQFLDHHQGSDREGFVDLDDVQVRRRDPGPFQRTRRGVDGCGEKR